MSLFEFRYPLLHEPVFWEGGRVRLASLDDLACMKLSAISQRGSRKDFYDLYTLCRLHRPLWDFLGLYRQKFKVEDVGSLIYSLVYFADAEVEPDLLMIKPVNWKAVKKAFQTWVKEIAGRQI
jgi:hypothetical protein